MTFEYVEGDTGRLEDTTFCVREHVTVGGSLAAGTVASDLAGWLKTKAKAMAPTSLTLTQVRVNRGGPYGPDEGADPEAGNEAVDEVCTGSFGSTPIPHGICARVTIYTALASRRGRGRFHAPSPLAQLQLSSADVFNTSGAYFVAVKDFADTLLAGHDVTHDAIDHHYSLRVHSRVDHTTRDAQKVLVRPQVSYLRSRLSAP